MFDQYKVPSIAAVSQFSSSFVAVMFKHTKKLVLACVLITILNLIYSVSNNYPVDLQAIAGKHVFNSIKGSTVGKQTPKMSRIGYHHDLQNSFMVIQEQPDYNQEFTDDVTNQFWQFSQSEAAVKDNFDIFVINGYDYEYDTISLDPYDKHTNLTSVELAEYEVAFLENFITFFTKLLEVIEESKPKIAGINDDDHYYESKQNNDYQNREGRIPIYGGHLRENYLEEPIRNKQMLSNFLRLSREEVEALSGSHNYFMEHMPREFPKDLLKYGQYSQFMKGDGIVYLGGGKYNQLVLLSIKTLRSNGSKLPVEVIIPKRGDFDIDLCLKILPKLNGKCKIMSDYLPKSFIDEVKGYQYKNVALLISSFARILYLDADNLPIKNPDVFFTNKPFTNKHLVLWPDLWRRSTSPSYYDIASIDIDLNSKVRNSYFHNDRRGKGTNPKTFSMHDCKGTIPEASSETGQLLIDKNIHFRTLILSMYYNYFGPNYYYPLFSQGAAGEGDKETFIAAAHKLKLPYYQVKEFNREFGPMNRRTNRHELFGMGQYDPIVDYIQSNEDETMVPELHEHPDKEVQKVQPVGEITEMVEINVPDRRDDDETEEEELPFGRLDLTKDQIEKERARLKYYNDAKPIYANNDADNLHNNYDYHLFKYLNLFFLHANWPKFYIHEMFIGNSFGRGPKDGKQRRRLYNKDLIRELNGYDFELHVMHNVKWCFCDLAHFNLKAVPETNSEDRRKICKEIDEQIDFLTNDPSAKNQDPRAS